MHDWTTVHVDDQVEPAASTADVIRVAGSPRTRGELHGYHAADKIRRNIDLLDALVADHPEADWSRLDALVESSLEFAAGQDPHLVDTIAGIADGADLDPRLVRRLNLPVHFLLGRIPLDCSQLYLGPGRAHGAYLTKTRDFPADRSFAQVLLHSEEEDGFRTVAGHSAGSVTWPGSGITSHGVAYSTSGVWSDRVVADPARIGHGWLLFNGEIVARHAQDAAHFARRAAAQSRLVGINLLVADISGALSVELTADDAAVREATDGSLVLTNHYPTTDGTFGELGPRADEYDNTFRRARFLEESAAATTNADLAAVARIMSSAPVCREAEPESVSVSEYTSIADVPGRALSIRFAS